MVVVEPVFTQVTLEHEVLDSFVAVALMAVTVDVEVSLVVLIQRVFILFVTLVLLGLV